MSSVRPTSLFQYDNPPQPEKEALDFDIQLNGAPEEIIQLVNNIKQVGEQFLYHWKTFPIILPPPADAIQPAHGSLSSNGEIPYITGNEGNRNNSSTLGRKGTRPPTLIDLFSCPSFDELDAVAMDSSGEPHRLNGKQLESIGERGEFEVASINFPGQMHRWRLSSLLQRGVLNTYDTLHADMALALRFIVVTAKARLFSHFFSIAQALTSLLNGLTKVLDLVLGIPSLQAVNLEARLAQERSRYLIAELLPVSMYEDSVEGLCIFIRRMLRRVAAEKFEIEKDLAHLPVPIPYLFTTPKGFEVDLRLFNKNIMNQATPYLTEILERGTRGWFLHFREKLILELRQQKIADDQIEKEVNEAVMKEYLDRVFTSIRNCSALQSLGSDIPNLLIEHAQAFVLMHRAVENMQKKLELNKESLKERLISEHPILSRIDPWLRDKIRASELRFKEECKWSAHEEALSLCTAHHLSQTVYFLHRDLTFMKEREPVLKKELRNDKKPTRTFKWSTKIWMSTNWIVKRHFQGQAVVIPTVLSSTPTSITTPRSDPSQPVFVLEKEIIRSSTTRWPLWRWINYCHRTWSWTWNAMFFFGVVMPWHSPVSLRALTSPDPFTPNIELSQVNGTLFPHQSSTTPTMISTLRALARHVAKQTSHIDSKPDTGFIGKGITRNMHKMWNYIGKGVFGTLGIVLIFPPICILTSLLSLIIAATAFLWMPLATLGLQILMWLIWDWDCPIKERNRYFVLLEALVLNVFLQGIIQPIVAVIIAFILCPFIAFVVFSFGVVRFCWRMLWDKAVFHLIIKKKGRVPAADSLIVKRISGPGLNTLHYFQIRPELALAVFEAKLELDELDAYQQQMEQKILQPQKDFSDFVTTCFGPFSATINDVGAYDNLMRESQVYLLQLMGKLCRRRMELQPSIISSVRSKLKMTTIDLKIAIQQGALMLERFYPNHVLSRLTISEQEFWESKGLSPNDWPGLAASLYSEIFNLDFLAPLDETANCFKLEPSGHIDLSRYRELVVGAVGLDLLGPVYAPRTNIQVHPPYLEVCAFGPQLRRHRTAQSNTSSTPHKPWKSKHNPYNAEKLVIPLPIPHPVQIAVTIYNRDAETPLPGGNAALGTLLLALEQGTEDGVFRYRGGGGDNDSSLSSCSAPDSVGSITAPWPDRPWRPPPAVCVDLASPEDITLDSDSTRVVGLPLGTTV